MIFGKTTCRLTLSMSLLVSFPALAAPACDYETFPAGQQKIGEWINPGNWLTPGNLRPSLQTPETFMPGVRLRATGASSPLRTATTQLDLEATKTTDPADGLPRSLAFLLESRLNADALLVLHSGKVIASRYGNGLDSTAPRLLLHGSRGVLSMLAAMAIAQGKLAPSKSLTRHVRALSNNIELRKLSMQRLLDGKQGYEWPENELAGWLRASGWSGQPDSDIRHWLGTNQWAYPFTNHSPPRAEGSPDDDLLLWALTESRSVPIAQLFCESIFAKLRPENPALWMTDAAGKGLAGGLAISLPDYARLGQMLLDARASSGRSHLPRWFIETLSAPSTGKNPPAAELTGLPDGSEIRYGIARLGGNTSRIAMLGPYGNSLFVDFEHGLVVAIFASHPETRSPLQLALLAQIWQRITTAVTPESKR